MRNKDYLNGTCQAVGYIKQQMNSQFLTLFKDVSDFDIY